MTTTRAGLPGRSTKLDDAPAPRRDRSKVPHFWWVADMNFAAEVGVDMRSLCGVWAPPERPGQTVETLGEVFPITERDDCKRWVNILAAYNRRRWIEMNR